MRRIALFLAGICLAANRMDVRAVDYVRDIKPLLAKQCVPCHGERQQKGGLRLDTASNALQGGKSGKIIQLQDPGQSLLILSVLGQSSEVERMPYKRSPLDSAEIEKLRAWIQSGAQHPDSERPSSDKHWAFEPPQRTPIPSPVGVGTPRNPVDAFVLEKLRASDLGLSPRADRRVLLRRLGLDLTGLPPSVEAIQTFERDQQPGATERAIERLLASSHYGERWARWWLDAARYADSNGYSIDSPRSIWPYRDWVVRVINADMGFDEFTRLQIAGDLIPTPEGPPNLDALLATGFHRNTQVNHEGGVDPEQFRIESVIDRVNTTATVWLGLTLGCAQCHDHKFDPFTMRDYYQFFAYFNSCENDGHGNAALEAVNHVEIGTPEAIAALAAHRAKTKRMDAELQSWITETLAPGQSDWERTLTTAERGKLKPEVQASLDVPADKRNSFQRDTVFNAFKASNATYQERRRELDQHRRQEPSLPTSLVMKELSQPRETRMFIKGDFTRPGESVTPATPAVLPQPAPDPQSPARLRLAQWLVSRSNPLTARVIVNRVWQQYFGHGIVETENDFGSQGSPPTHPELLDWLALDFMDHGWSLKHLHRVITSSATYQQSSRIEDSPHVSASVAIKSAEVDPLNRLLWRQNRLRLDAEIIRDTQLAASGLLDATLGGPPVFPPQPAGLDAFTQNKREWKTSTGGARYRRALYTHIQRTTFHPALSVFDAADGYFTCTRRVRSNTPLQSLTLLNDPAYAEFAEALGRWTEKQPGNAEARIARSFERCLGRKPSKQELATLLELFHAEISESLPPGEAYRSVARALLNLDEMITRE